MRGRDFYNNVQDHESLEWLGVQENEDSIKAEALVLHKESGIRHAIEIGSILKSDWEDLRDVLLGKRDPLVMIHLTRIVGYYSRVSNWNLSKKQELVDRRRGEYILPGDGYVYDREKAHADSTNVPGMRNPVRRPAVSEKPEVLFEEAPERELTCVD